MAANINILKCSADYNKIYYIEYEGAIRQCRLLATEGTDEQAYYVLEIAGIGTRKIEPKDKDTQSWWYSSTVESVLAKSPKHLSNKTLFIFKGLPKYILLSIQALIKLLALVIA